MNTVQNTALAFVGSPSTPLELLHQYQSTSVLFSSGDIRYGVQNGNQGWIFTPYAYSVIASTLANMASSGVNQTLPNPAINPLAPSEFRFFYDGLLKSFVPGAVANSNLHTNHSTSIARYGNCF